MQLVRLISRPLTLLLCLCLGSSLASLAQTAPDSSHTESLADTTEITWRSRKFVIIKDEDGKRLEITDTDDEPEVATQSDYDYDHENKEVRHRPDRSDIGFLGFDLGITNYYVNGTYGADAATPELEVREFRPGSHVALHFLPTRVGFDKRGYVNLKTAITIDWSNYYYTNDITLLSGGETLAFDTTGINFSKNKLMARYAQIPLMLNINTDPGGNDGISISVGGYAGILWGARTKQVSEEEGTVKVPGTFFLNPYRYGLIARVDFKWFDIYLHYNLSTLFEAEEGPETQTFMAGINLIDF